MTMANYLEKVQWAVRPDSIPNISTALWSQLDVDEGEITKLEVERVIKNLKRGKAAGPDNIPSDVWIQLSSDTECLEWIVTFCNQCWRLKQIPDSWHQARVSCIVKKGDCALCENYRPISLLNIGYKIFSAILLNRFKDVGAETRIWSIQFGFISGFDTVNALFLVRRKLEVIFNESNKHLTFLTLDWAKAFDSIDPESLVQALRRFGIPFSYLMMIKEII